MAMTARGAGRMALVVALLPMAVGAAERTSAVKVWVAISGGAQRWRHEITIANKKEHRRVVSVLLWQDVGLPEEPKDLTAPDGWEVRTEERGAVGKHSWAVRFSCKWPAASIDTSRPVDDQEIGCGLRAGEAIKFQVTLPFPWEDLEKTRILIGFSDGRLGIAS